jgi:DNA-binding NtrC family response regulator
MKLIRIDERLPDAPLESEVVLHLRRHLRAAIRARAATAPRDLAHLFGFPREDGTSDDWRAAAAAADPMQAGAVAAARRRGDGAGVVCFGHDSAHVLECKRWLAARKVEDDTFAAVKATDGATLLELSKARDVACARGVDSRGRERFLPVLIQGPTGTGKELLAEAIHRLWAKTLGRMKAPFEVVQVAGMSPDMVNDELFGHARGAFTGANKDRPGRVEAADGGTLLIDEVGDLSAEAQLRLLRFLQTQAVSRIGENKERQLAVRVIAATLHDIDARVAAGAFREDLLHRLRVGSGLFLPPLSAREGLFDEVLPDLLNDRHHVAHPLLTRSARDALAHHNWPGNLRELVGVLDEVVALAAGETIRLEHLPPHLQRKYLQLPLYARALGFLLEEVDGQGLPEEHVRWRIEQINASIAAAPLPPPNEQLGTLGQFLSLLDDSSDEHRRAVNDVQRLLELDQAQRQAARNSIFWEQVLRVGAPTEVERLVRSAVSDATAGQQALQNEIESLHRSGAIESDPWLRLFKEIHGLPLLREASGGELAKAFLATFNVLKLVAPSVIEHVRADAKAGGFTKIRERVVKLLQESNDSPREETIDAPPEARPAGRLGRADWQRIARDFATQRAAVQATGYDPKTIAKYFQKHRIRHPWKAV